jgi:hypothetical protein
LFTGNCISSIMYVWWQLEYSINKMVIEVYMLTPKTIYFGLQNIVICQLLLKILENLIKTIET